MPLRFLALIPDFSEVRLPDAGHFANIERPDAVLAAIAATAAASALRDAAATTAVSFADRPLQTAA